MDLRLIPAALMLIHRCLANRRQVHNKPVIQLLEGNVFGVPQGCILEPLLPNLSLL